MKDALHIQDSVRLTCRTRERSAGRTRKGVMTPMIGRQSGRLARIDARLSLFCLVLVSICAVTMFTTAAAETVPAGTSALVLKHLVVQNTSGLRFGKFAADPALDGEIIMDEVSKTRIPTNVDLISNGVSGASAATFTVDGTLNEQVMINLPPGPETLTRAGGPETMSVDQFSTPNTLLTLTSVPVTFNVGARLIVNAGQEPGDYSGTFSVEVIYQ